MDGARTIGTDEPVKCYRTDCDAMVVGVRYCDPHRHFVDTLTITTTFGFTFWDRVKLLLGWKFHAQHKVPILVDRNVAQSPPVAEPTTWYSPPFHRRQRTVGMLSA